MNSWRRKCSIMRRYDLTAQIYDSRYGEEQETKYKASLEGLNIDHGIVLDAGCGSGLFFTKAANRAAIVVGVDSSHQLLLLAKERAKKYSNVFLIQADADHLPFKQPVFSHVFAFTLLQNMPKPEETLKQLTAVAMHGAFFVITGLKAAVSLEALRDFLTLANLQPVTLRTDEALKCNIITCVQHKTG